MQTNADCGTAVENTPRITIQPIEGINSLLILQLAGSLAQVSEHPFARAIVQDAHRKKLGLFRIRKYKVQRGIDISGCVEGLHVAIGGDCLKTQHRAGAPELDVAATALYNKGQAVAYVFVEGCPAGVIGVAHAGEEQTCDW